MGKHKSYAAKKKSLEYIKAQRKGIRKEICMSNHNKNCKYGYGEVAF